MYMGTIYRHILFVLYTSTLKGISLFPFTLVRMLVLGVTGTYMSYIHRNSIEVVLYNLFSSSLGTTPILFLFADPNGDQEAIHQYKQQFGCQH